MAQNRRQLTTEDYENLLEFRDGLRRFLRWSESQARELGLTPAQHQLLLAIRGHGEAPSVGEVAEHLLLRHHSAVELVNRAEAANLVIREVDPDDHRVVRLQLSERAEEALSALSSLHVEELSRLRGTLDSLWQDLE